MVSQHSVEKLANLRSVVDRLDAGLLFPLDEHQMVLAGVVKHFELVFELFWETLKTILETEEQYEVIKGPRDAFQKAYAAHLIDDEKAWSAMLLERNQTVYFYGEQQAFVSYQKIKKYLPVIKRNLEKLEQRYR